MFADNSRETPEATSMRSASHIDPISRADVQRMVERPSDDLLTIYAVGPTIHGQVPPGMQGQKILQKDDGSLPQSSRHISPPSTLPPFTALPAPPAIASRLPPS